MKLQDIEFIKLLPEFMRNDSANIGLSKAVDNLIKYLASYGPKLSIWTAIDELDEYELDKLAWDLNLTWYDQNTDISVKRKLIKDYVGIKSQLGTCWAINQVISTYFGDGYVQEWFEYNGTPGYFKVISSNPYVKKEDLSKFIKILNKIKRASSHLESIDIGLSGKSTINHGVAIREIEHIEIKIG